MQYGFRAIARGGRKETYDVEVLEAPVRWPVELGPTVGKYEVKRLSRSGKTRWDPRFKTSGARGSRIYGRHSALVKAAALELEAALPSMDLGLLVNNGITEDTVREAFEHMLADAFSDRHSHRFRGAFDAMCGAVAGMGYTYVDRYLRSPITSGQIVSGYSDLDGLFIIRGDTYTLIKRDKIHRHIGFDSFGSEGLKLRLLDLGVVSDKQQRSGKR